MTDAEKLQLYRHALGNLCKEHGGEFFVGLDDLEPGTLMNRLENEGVRFRFVADRSVQ